MVGDTELKQKVEVMADLIDLTSTYRLVKVSLSTTEPGIDRSTDLVFKNGSPTTVAWEYPYKDAAKRALDYTVTYFTANGSSSSKTVTGSKEATVVLPQSPN